LGESLVASGSGGTGGDSGLVFLLEEFLDQLEVLVPVGNGCNECGLVVVVLGVLASSKSLGNCDILENLVVELLLEYSSSILVCLKSSCCGFDSIICKLSNSRNSSVGLSGRCAFRCIIGVFLGCIELTAVRGSS